MDALTETLAKLSQLDGPPGYEDEVRKFIAREAGKYTTEVETDVIGNVYATVHGDSGAQKIVVDAHMDEVGFIIKYIEPRGFLRFEPLGGIDARILPGKRVKIKGANGPLRGTLGSKPPHILSAEESNKVPLLSDLFIDIGANTDEEARAFGAAVGSIATFEEPFHELGNGSRILGKAFDDRAGCTVGLAVLEALSKNKPHMNVVFAFTAQEELGMRGADVAMNHVRPDVGIALETTVAADVPDAKQRDWITALGSGASIRVLDSSMIAQRPMVEYLRKTAEKNGIAYQLQLARAGGTDAAKIHLWGTGVPTGLISTPCRYLHGPSCLLSTDDLRSVMKLTEAAIRGIESKEQFMM